MAGWNEIEYRELVSGGDNIAVAAALGAAAVEFQQVNGVSVAVLPDGDGGSRVEVVDVERHLAHPRRKSGTVFARDVASFIEYVKRHKTEATLIWADTTGGMKAVFNDHEPVVESANPDTMDIGLAGWGDHLAYLRRERTRSFAAWERHNETKLTQQAFAELLEDRIGEIIDPPGADLLEVAKFFQAHTKITFNSGRQLHNGQVDLQYVEDIEEKGGRAGQLSVPTEFTILMRPYMDSTTPADGADTDQFVVRAKLRWRIAEAKVVFWFSLAEEFYLLMEGVHRAAIERVRAETDVPVLLAGSGS